MEEVIRDTYGVETTKAYMVELFRFLAGSESDWRMIRLQNGIASLEVIGTVEEQREVDRIIHEE